MTASHTSAPRAPLAAAGVADAVRAGEWWEHKFVPVLAVFYATAAMLDVPVARLWVSLALLLAAIAPGAVYVSLVNDITDREEDRAAGKANRTAGRSRIAVVAIILAMAAIGLAFAWWWRSEPAILLPYLGAWTAFSLYSLPPVRLKTRGMAGVIADASGSHLFPALLAAGLALRGAGAAVDPLWLAIIGGWAFACGLRGILWHQLLDAENDRAAGVRTFVQRHSPRLAERLGTYAIFPLEAAALAALLWRLHSAAALLALAAYAALALLRLRVFRMRAVIVAPAPRGLIVLQEYYALFLPIALLIASAARHPADLLILLAHLILFPRAPLQALRDANSLRRSLI
jgi:4-hydroxybenzoate polyprenyltransferase